MVLNYSYLAHVTCFQVCTLCFQDGLQLCEPAGRGVPDGAALEQPQGEGQVSSIWNSNMLKERPH